MWAANSITLYPPYHDMISLTSLKVTQASQLLLDFAENQTAVYDFKFKIVKSSDNGD